MKISITLSMLLIKKAKALNALVIFMIAVSMFLLSCALTANNGLSILLDLSESIKDDKITVFFNNLSSEDEVDVITSLQNIKSIEKQYSIYLYSGADCFDTYYYTDYLQDNVKLNVADGKWFTEAEQSPGCIRAVASSNSGFDVGDLIDFNVNDTTVKLQITGILPEDGYYLSFNGFSLPSTLENLFESYDGETENFLICENELDCGIENGSVILFDDNITEEAYQQNIEILKAITSDVTTMQEMYSATEYYVNEEQQIYMPIFVSFGLLSMVAFISIFLYVNGNSKKSISAARLIGADKKIILFTELIYFGVIMVCALILYTVFSVFSINPLSSATFNPDAGTFILVPLLYCAAFFGISYLSGFLYNKNIVTLY